ncbi:major facilitator superfamily domain-containing protein [Pelagophyceae sp. CCMP2097]|nr:major facilitator superfamily domain-containing protein [Pelagophyceae sp. CCMP2097]
MALRFLEEAVTEQRALARELLGDGRTRAPVIAVYLAAFGSSLHEAVTAYFYVAVGADVRQIGAIASITLGVAVLAGPAVGAQVDRNGAVGAMAFAALACAVGCAVRGLAHNVGDLYASAAVLGLGGDGLDVVVTTYLAAVLDARKRSTLLAGFAVANISIKLLAKAVAPFALGAIRQACHTRLLAYRIVLSVCWAFCAYGFFTIVAARHSLVSGPLAALAAPPPAKALGRLPDAGDAAASDELAQLNRKRGDAASAASLWLFGLGAVAIVCQSAALTAATVLWPLVVRDSFGWDSAEFSYLLFFHALAGILVSAAAPPAERRLGRGAAAEAAAAVAAAAAALLVALPARAAPAKSRALAHAGLYSLHVVALQVLGLHARSIATLAAPRSFIGRGFGAISALAGVSGAGGALAATALYASSTAGQKRFLSLSVAALGAALLALRRMRGAEAPPSPAASGFDWEEEEEEGVSI